jgi:hypothetical protein
MQPTLHLHRLCGLKNIYICILIVRLIIHIRESPCIFSSEHFFSDLLLVTFSLSFFRFVKFYHLLWWQLCELRPIRVRFFKCQAELIACLSRNRSEMKATDSAHKCTIIPAVYGGLKKSGGNVDESREIHYQFSRFKRNYLPYLVL